MRQVGHGQQQGRHLGLELLQPRRRAVQLALEGIDLGFGGLGFVFFALAHERANLLAQGVAFVLQFFGAGLEGLALGLQGAELVGVQEGLRVLARLQARQHTIEVFAEQGEV